MQPGLSTYVFLSQRLHPGLLDAMLRGLAPYGDPVIEVFAARHHFDYTDRSIVRELAIWFRDAGVKATLHQPLFLGSHWSRHVSPTLNLIDPEKSRRIEAMDEVKRALESAEQIPFSSLSLHLGLKNEAWNTRALENSLTAIEHVKAFAHPLGVKVLLENLQNDVTTPEHLLEILNIGHFTNVGVALDLGHAHLSDPEKNRGVDEAVALLKPRVGSLQLHDNGGRHDDHAWPGTAVSVPDATEEPSTPVDWLNAGRHVAGLPDPTPAILEISHELNETPESVTAKTLAFFDQQARLAEKLQTS